MLHQAMRSSLRTELIMLAVCLSDLTHLAFALGGILKATQSVCKDSVPVSPHSTGTLLLSWQHHMPSICW